MADIDSIIAGANGNTKYDFSAFGDPVKSFFDANKQRAEFDQRRMFKDGVPTDDNGQPDFAAMSKAYFQKGDAANGIAAANLGLQRDQLKLGQQASERIGQMEGAPQPTIPPSANRTSTVAVAPPTSKTGAPPQQQSQGGGTIMQVLAAQGIPNTQLGAASASIARQLGLDDPNAPVDLNDPRIRNVIVPAVAQLKRMGVGQVAQPGQPTQQEIPPAAPQGQPQAVPVQQPQPAPAQPQPAPQAAQPAQQPAPVTDRLTTGAQGEPSRTDKLIANYAAIMSNPSFPKSVQEAAKTRLEALQKSAELTPDQKMYSQSLLQGYKGTLQDWIADNESRKTAATEEAKASTKKYETLVENGTKAQMEIPQLDLLKEQMNDPNFFSGAGEKYNLLYKRLKAAVGIDPEAAVPQEYLRKATAANVLSSLGALKGLGQIRVAEINMAREAAASPDNSIPANKLLVEISKRTHERNAQIAEMAQDYKEKNGVLDAGFDKKVTAYYKQNPLFTDAEIKDWHKVTGEQKTAPTSAPPGGTKTFNSPADVRAAMAAGTIKSGDTFVDGAGKTRVVP